jgi:BlaI family transcriptional regulator, penicillinase repressor
LTRGGGVLKNQHMPKPGDALTRREQQVMDILFRRGQATVAEVMDDLPEPPTYSAVRSILRILAEKGLITHREDGPRYVYLPARSRQSAREEALRHLVRTYFEGSAEQAVTALLRLGEAGVSEADLRRLRSAVRKARSSGR